MEIGTFWPFVLIEICHTDLYAAYVLEFKYIPGMFVQGTSLNPKRNKLRLQENIYVW